MISTSRLTLLAAWFCIAWGTAAADDTCLPNSTAADDPKRLVLAVKTDLKTLDPYALNDNFTLGLLGNTYEGLVKRAPNGDIVPGLAERWQLMEPTRWRFYLRPNVKFQKGQDFTADDVVYSADRVRKRGSDLTSILPRDAKVIKVDTNTVDVVLSSPNPGLVAEWDSWYMMSKPWIEVSEAGDPSSFDPKAGLAATTANGTGAFSVTELLPGKQMQLKPNPHWWNTPHHRFGRVDVCINPDDGQRADALLTSGPGRVDWMDSLAPIDWQRVAQSTKAKAVKGEDLQVVFLGFDVARDKLTGRFSSRPNPFKDPKVRRAIYQAIDIDAIQSRIMRNFSIKAESIVAASLFPPIKNIKRWNYDVSGAKTLLAGTAYPDGFAVEMDCPNDRFINDEDICKDVKDMLYRIGVQVELILQSRDDFYAKVLARGEYNTSFYLFGWMPGSFDALGVLTNVMACRDAKTGRGHYNIGGSCNLLVENLIGQILSETDSTKRNALILEAFQKVHEDVAAVPLHQQMALTGRSNTLSSVERRDARIVFDEFSKP
jgi:peptide/nickel transport system substrate-binding protein